jgi:ribosome biogenesis GTPase A
MVQWFPGHMMKAKKEMEEVLKIIDIVLELIDARIPSSSQNPLFHGILKNKPRLFLLTKSTLADDKITKQWLHRFEEEGKPALIIDAISGFQVNRIAGACRTVLQEKIERELARGMKKRPIRAMVIGVPNVGKSTLINQLVKKKVSMVGNKPGVTKAQQWIRINQDLELLDTPGVLWPKFEDPIQGYHLALTGAIRDEILKTDELALYLLNFLKEHYPSVLSQKYTIDITDDVTIMLGKIRTVRGLLDSDHNRVYEVLIKDFRSGILGRISLDW